MLFRRVPPNVQFEVDDIEEPWLYSRPFDFIHSRFCAGCLADWPKLVRQTYQQAALPALSSLFF